jgi:hypothetical protein
LGRVSRGIESTVAGLALAEARVIERVTPAKVVPVVDVKLDREDRGAGALRSRRNAGYRRVRSRTAGTPLGREQLDDRHARLRCRRGGSCGDRARRLRSGRVGSARPRAAGEKNEARAAQAKTEA